MTTEQTPSLEQEIPTNAPDRGAEDNDRFQGYIDAANDSEADDTFLYELPDETAEETPAPVEEPVGEIPAQPVPPIPPQAAPPLPSEVETLRQQNEIYAQQLQQAELQRQSQLLEAQTSQMATELQNQGLMPNEAAQIAQQQTMYRQQAMQAQQQAKAYAEYQQGKMNAAFHYGQQHNVSPQQLMQYDTPQAMEQAAQSQSQISSLQQQVAKLTRSQVPPQYMDNNQTTPTQGSSHDRLIDSALNKPANQWTQAEAQAMREISGG